MSPDEKSPEKPKAEPASVAAEQPQDQSQNVQHVVQQKSLSGVGGWLIFWMIVFGLYSVSFLMLFFVFLAGTVESGLPSGASGALAVETMIFGVLITAAYIISTILIAMQKKLAKLMSLISIWLTALYLMVISVTSMVAQFCTTSYWTGVETCKGIGASGVIMLIFVIIAALIYAGLTSMYFFMSKRVKATLVK